MEKRGIKGTRNWVAGHSQRLQSMKKSGSWLQNQTQCIHDGFKLSGESTHQCENKFTKEAPEVVT